MPECRSQSVVLPVSALTVVGRKSASGQSSVPSTCWKPSTNVDWSRLVGAPRASLPSLAPRSSSVPSVETKAPMMSSGMVGLLGCCPLAAGPFPRLSDLANSGNPRPRAAYAPTMAPADVPAMTVLAPATKPASISRAASTPISHAIPTSPPPPRISPTFTSCPPRCRCVHSRWTGDLRDGGEQAPGAGHAFQRMVASVLEGDAGRGSQVGHCPRDKDFAGVRKVADALGGADREADYIVGAELDFAGVDTGPHLQVWSACCGNDLRRGAHGPCGRIEG